MSYNFENLVNNKQISHVSNFKDSSRNKNDIKYIVLHFTANDGDTDTSNAKYFQSANRGASAHFFVDDDSITQSVEVKDIAWHCGGKLYNDIKVTGGGKFYSLCTNSNSIGIEMCDTLKNGIYEVSDKTKINALKLVKALMTDFDIDINHVIRHFDVTGKYCPRYFCLPYGSNDDWIRFRNEIVNTKNTSENKVNIDIKAGSTVKIKAGATQYNGKAIKDAYFDKIYTVNEIIGTRAVLSIDKVVIYAVSVDNLQLVNSTNNTSVFKEYKVRVTVGALNYRTGPGTKYTSKGIITDMGVYSIVDKKDGWGKLKSGAGWICLDYTKRV